MEFSAPALLEVPSGLNPAFNNQLGNYTGSMFDDADVFRTTNVEGLDGAELRTPLDNRSQQDGPIVHNFYRAAMHVAVTGYIKCSDISDRNAKEDALKGAVAEIIRRDGRWRFLLAGMDERFLTVRQETPVTLKQIDGLLHEVTFGLVSSREPFVYTLAERDTTINNGATVFVPNAGNAPTFPLYQLYAAGGGSTNFVIENMDTGQTITGSGMTIPSGHYAEMIVYRRTFYKDGDGANLLGHLVFSGTATNFFYIDGLTDGSGGAHLKLTGDFDHMVVKTNDGWI